MSYTNHVVITLTLVLTITAITLTIIALAKQDWRKIVVSMRDTPILNGTEGLWKYCENDGECISLNTDDTGGWLIAVRVFAIFSCVLYFLAFFAILTRIMGNMICVPFSKKTKCQAHTVLALLAALLLLASSLLYGLKVNYDEKEYTAEMKEVDKRILYLNASQKNNMYNILNNIKYVLDHFPTESPDVSHEPTTISPPGNIEVTTLAPQFTMPPGDHKDESQDDVYYKAEVKCCYHVAIFGAVLGLIAFGLSLYQSCRDISEDRDMQRL